jgi:hypothetical protein
VTIEALGKDSLMILSIESDISRVASETAFLYFWGILDNTETTSEDLIPETVATRDPLPPCAFLLVTIV